MTKAILAQPRGFCAGVVRAVEIVEQALAHYPPPIYVLHEIVHNRYVVDSLSARGAIFVETLEDVPTGAVCIFSAHGVATAIIKQAQTQALEIIDATCPLVTKVHIQAKRYVEQGYTLIIIGHSGHPEVEGTRGQVTGTVHILSTLTEVNNLQIENPERLAYVTQTTLSVDDTREVIQALHQRYPHIQGPELRDICYATQNRQNAVRELAQTVDIILVVGAQNSSNSNRLREVGELAGTTAYLIQDARDIQPNWFKPDTIVGITAGASAPEILVEGVIERLHQLGITQVETLNGKPETIVFQLPAKLLQKMST